MNRNDSPCIGSLLAVTLGWIETPQTCCSKSCLLARQISLGDQIQLVRRRGRLRQPHHVTSNIAQAGGARLRRPGSLTKIANSGQVGFFGAFVALRSSTLRVVFEERRGASRYVATLFRLVPSGLSGTLARFSIFSRASVRRRSRDLSSRAGSIANGVIQGRMN